MTLHTEYISVKQFLKVVDEEESIMLSTDIKEKLKRTNRERILKVTMDIEPDETKIINLLCDSEVLIEGGKNEM